MLEQLLPLVLIFFAIAAVYATAGFGGGSSYLAVLTLTGLAVADVRSLALLCNVIVAGNGTLRLARAGELPWRKALPLVIGSVPLAYLGGRVDLPRAQFLPLLGVVLLLAALAMFFRDRLLPRDEVEPTPGTLDDSGQSFTQPVTTSGTQLIRTGLLGSGLGFLAGLVSIGGGIFLSPVLFLLRWDTARRIAAVTSLFILVNSLAGLAGRLSVPFTAHWLLSASLAVAVFFGGQLGTRLTIARLSPVQIRRVAAGLILLVAVRLLYQSLTAA